jgi:hypothetical protein
LLDIFWVDIMFREGGMKVPEYCYFGHTKPTRTKRRFRSVEGVRSFLKTQMIVRTVKHGLISRETSLALARELFPTVDLDEVMHLFTEPKQRYLWSRDLEAG